MTLVPPTKHEHDTLIDALLAEQRELTAVEQFARWHESPAAITTPAYRRLIPTAAPLSGEQYAFEVDLDKCSGCKACVTACHALNGLEDDEAWRSVGLLVGQSKSRAAGPRRKGAEGLFPFSPLPLFSSAPFQQHVTTACHHCIDPACLNGCPVLAYEKDPVTGIVRHLDDQCIGCQYCVMMCPYDVPKYSERLGIVRKCDMCRNRLAEGEAPACVQACPNEAIRITLVETAELQAEYRPSVAHDNESGKMGKWESGKAALHSHFPTFSPAHFLSSDSCEGVPVTNRFLPSSPDPSITLPTTRYLSAKSMPADLIAADEAAISVQPGHMPLVWMLVLTQCAAGGFAVWPFTATTAQPLLACIALAAVCLGLIASSLHLGKPWKAWRAFLGLRRSWLSREIVAFGIFVILAALLTTGLLTSNTILEPHGPLAVLTAISGLLGVFCSGMVYHATRRDFWLGHLSLGKFFGTAAVLGLAAAWSASEMAGVKTMWLAATLVVISIIRLALEFALLRRCPDDADLSGDLPASSLARSAMLLRFGLGLSLRTHLSAAWIGGVVLPAVSLLVASAEPWLAGSAAMLCFVSEFTERRLFFLAVVPLKMPGGVAT